MRTGKRSLVSVISVGVALILGLAGCGGGGQADTEDAADAADVAVVNEEEATEDVEETDVEEADAEEAVLTGGGIVVIDDDFVTVEVLGVQTDWADDPGYVLFILNKTDHEIAVKDKWESFTVDGREVNPSLSATVAPGEYIEAFLGFNDEDLGGGVSALTNVKGQLTVRNTEISETLGHIDVELPNGSELTVIED